MRDTVVVGMEEPLAGRMRRADRALFVAGIHAVMLADTDNDGAREAIVESPPLSVEGCPDEAERG